MYRMQSSKAANSAPAKVPSQSFGRDECRILVTQLVNDLVAELLVSTLVPALSAGIVKTLPFITSTVLAGVDAKVCALQEEVCHLRAAVVQPGGDVYGRCDPPESDVSVVADPATASSQVMNEIPSKVPTPQIQTVQASKYDIDDCHGGATIGSDSQALFREKVVAAQILESPLSHADLVMVPPSSSPNNFIDPVVTECLAEEEDDDSMVGNVGEECVGSLVITQDLSATHLNDQIAVVLEDGHSSERVAVKLLATGKECLLKHANLRDRGADDVDRFECSKCHARIDMSEWSYAHFTSFSNSYGQFCECSPGSSPLPLAIRIANYPIKELEQLSLSRMTNDKDKAQTRDQQH